MARYLSSLRKITVAQMVRRLDKLTTLLPLCLELMEVEVASTNDEVEPLVSQIYELLDTACHKADTLTGMLRSEEEA